MENTSPKEVIIMLRNKLDQISEESPESTEDVHRLFLYYTAEYDQLPVDKINICDRSGDRKIDFYYVSEDCFAIYQCTIPELDILEKQSRVFTYGDDLVNKIEDMLTFITDDTGAARGNKSSQEARNRYRSANQLSIEETGKPVQLEAVLCMFGELSGPAKGRLTELRSNWEADSTRVRIISYNDIVSSLSIATTVTKARPKEIWLPIMKNTRASARQWCSALVPAKTFYDLFDQYKMGLFDSNVRYYLEKSSVNRKIMDTLKDATGQKNFYLLNNGISITCTGWNLKKPEKIVLYNPQIINGCQTAISIYRSYTQFDEEYKRKDFESKCFVQVRAINTQEPGLIDEIVIASNDQNKMEPRNLMSNSIIQRRIQKQFDLLKPRWFYQRKDGEFTSLKEYKHADFKPRTYEYSTKKYRVIDNETLAKAWLSFIGMSKDASERIRAFENIEDGGRYEWLFERTPKNSHWELLTKVIPIEFIETNFDNRSPSAEQYLLAYIINEFIRAFILSPFANRQEALRRLKDSGRISDTSSLEEINKVLMDDDSYVLNSVLSNMKEVIVELYAWILIKRYGPISRETALEILNIDIMRRAIEKPDLKSFISEIKNSEELRSSDNILYSIFEFIKESVIRWYSIHRHEYQSAQRRIRYLHKEETIIRMKRNLNDTNEHTKSIAYTWKEPRKKFIDCLPEFNY